MSQNGGVAFCLLWSDKPQDFTGLRAGKLADFIQLHLHRALKKKIQTAYIKQVISHCWHKHH